MVTKIQGNNMRRFISSLSTILLISFSFSSFGEEKFCNCSYASLVEPLIPAVVNITTLQKNTPHSGMMQGFPQGSPFEEFNQFFERFGIVPPGAEEENKDLDEKDLKPTSVGSGFIISKDGYIVTNHHVVADSEKFTVTLHNDQKYEAKLIGSDRRTDIAVLKIESKEELAFVKFGDSDIVKVGDQIVTIGNPFGLGSTVTTGIVSARSRDIRSGATSLIDNYIQTDAAINKGNSGGPMFNMRGEVIGINTAIYSPSGMNIGIGFAVPSSAAGPVVEEIKKRGKVTRVWLGVQVQSTEDIAEGLGIKGNQGALVNSVTKNSPADKAGISTGDIILKFDGKDITSERKLPKIVAETPVGKTVEIELMSKGKRKKIKCKLEQLDDHLFNDNQASTKPGSKEIVEGIGFINLSDELKQKYRLPMDVSGIVITEVKRKTPASRSGLRVGDVILAVNQKPISVPDDFGKLIEEAKGEKKPSVMLWIVRSNINIFMQLPLNK